jgi:(p)ppGpp synthase/HD superfamily hydrolase
MNLPSILENKALEYATDKHKSQKRKDGSQYIEHPKRVAEIVKKYKSSSKIDELVKAAFLHDTIEDTDTTEEDLEKLFGGLVASLVRELTSDKEKAKEVGKTSYLSDKMKNMSSWGLVIKLSDRLDNVSGLKTVKSKKFVEKYKKETSDILNNLEKERKILSRTHKKLIKEIRNKLEELD